MSYLQENNSQNLAARITGYGRRKIAQGDFNISYFQIGDSEFDYTFSEIDGNPSQKVLMPLDKDTQVKYPYKVSSSTFTGTTYGVPIQSSMTETIRNNISAAGFVSEYIPYNALVCSGSTIECGIEEIPMSALSGTTTLYVPAGNTFLNTTYITIFFDTLCVNNTIRSSAGSQVFKIVSLSTGVTYNTLVLDRSTPNFTDVSLSGKKATVISNDCGTPGNAWTLNNIWSQNPAGLDPLSDLIDEKLSGYTSNVFVSTKEFFGYNTSSGQTSNTGTTITNSFGDVITVLPEEQHSLSIIHFSKASDILSDPEAAFRYEDYIDHSADGLDYFEIYIPFLLYDRTGTTMGARFFMDSIDHYINSAASDTRSNQMKFRYLIDIIGNRVGKIFVNHKVIIFDDQEIVAALDYKSKRRYTLPIPRISLVPTDSKCDVNGDPLNPLLSGTTGQTVFVTYLLQYTGDTQLSGIACNHYLKLTGGSTDGDISIKFNTDDFRFMQSTMGISGATIGYIANKFQILVQRVTTGQQPDPMGWKIIDFTNQIPNHTMGGLIDPVNLRGARFIVNYYDWDTASLYVMDDPDIIDTATSPEFGDEQPFPASVRLTRATDIEVMRYLINLPTGYFETTQNPSWSANKPKRVTEIALLDSNKNVLVIAKTSSPIVRTGNQVFAVKIDI